MTAPMSTVSEMISAGQLETAGVLLEILQRTFSRKLSGGQARRLAHDLPRAAERLQKSKACWQLQQLARMMAIEPTLMDPFMEGVGKGLGLLHETALEQFVSRAITRYEADDHSGRKFLSLNTRISLA